MRQAKTIQRINNAQKALLHIAADEIGIDRDTYEDILDQYGGVRSSVDLTPAAFKRVMKHLEALGFKRRHKAPQVNSTARRDQYEHYRARWASLGLRPGMATPDQLARIECDWDELRWWWQGEDKKEAVKRPSAACSSSDSTAPICACSRPATPLKSSKP